MSVIDAAGAIRASSEPSHYPVNLRITVPFFPNRFFVTFIVGKERRGTERLRQERKRNPVSTWGNLTVLVAGWATLNIAGLFIALVATGL